MDSTHFLSWTLSQFADEVFNTSIELNGAVYGIIFVINVILTGSDKVKHHMLISRNLLLLLA